MKFCRKCQQDKDVEEFARNKSRPDGRQTYCKACNRPGTAPAPRRVVVVEPAVAWDEPRPAAPAIDLSVDRNPHTVRDFDPGRAQREMERAADRLYREAYARLNSIDRRVDPDGYEAARGDLRNARDARTTIKLFGPGHLVPA